MPQGQRPALPWWQHQRFFGWASIKTTITIDT
jgi:hypothetical protein